MSHSWQNIRIPLYVVPWCAYREFSGQEPPTTVYESFTYLPTPPQRHSVTLGIMTSSIKQTSLPCSWSLPSQSFAVRGRIPMVYPPFNPDFAPIPNVPSIYTLIGLYLPSCKHLYCLLFFFIQYTQFSGLCQLFFCRKQRHRILEYLFAIPPPSFYNI